LWSLGIVILLVLGELALRARYRQQVLPAGRRKPGEVTIVALGDSITAGWPGPPEQAWPAQLAARLQAAYPAVAWRVVNAGGPGDTAPMGYDRFDRDVAGHAPDVVLIAFGLNDCHRNRHALDRWFEARVPAGPERSYLWRTVQARIGRWLGWTDAPTYAPEVTPQPFPRTTLAGFSAALAALIDRTYVIGSRPVLLTTTPVSPQSPAAAHDALNECAVYDDHIRALAVQCGVPLVELPDDLPTDAFSADGVHLASTGQAWAADRVFATLETAGLWTALARRAQ
jgi:lysophospholipase L1-like esterase